MARSGHSRSRRSKRLFAAWAKRVFPCWDTTSAWRVYADASPRALGRGHAVTLGMDGPAEDVPIPNGMVWNMVYDADAPKGTLPSISHEELWRRLERFLEDVVPVAEQSGVRLAAHPDDPPMPTMRRQPRLVYQPHMYQRLIDLAPSPQQRSGTLRGNAGRDD